MHYINIWLNLWLVALNSVDFSWFLILEIWLAMAMESGKSVYQLPVPLLTHERYDVCPSSLLLSWEDSCWLMVHRRQELRRNTPSTSVSLKHTLPRWSPETPLSESLHCSEFPGAALMTSVHLFSFFFLFSPFGCFPFLSPFPHPFLWICHPYIKVLK